MRRTSWWFLGCAFALSGCVESSQSWLEKRLVVERGEAPSVALGDFSVRLESAQLAFGPLYLCAGAQAGSACDSARLEWLDSRVVELVGDGRVEIGTLVGLSGEVRSWMADYGFQSKLTETKPLVLEAARQLGASVPLRGVALRRGNEAPFEARLTVSASETTGRGRPALSSPTSPTLVLPIEEDGSSVVVRFPLSRWLEGLREPFFFEDADCSAERRVACSDVIERSCDAEGALLGERDCASEGLACVPGVGCAQRLETDEVSELGRALYLSVTGSGRPTFNLTPAE